MDVECIKILDTPSSTPALPTSLTCTYVSVWTTFVFIFFYLNIFCGAIFVCSVLVWHLLLFSQLRESAFGYVTFEEWIYYGVWLPILYRYFLLFSSFAIIQWQISFQRECLIKLFTQLKPICGEFVQHEQSNFVQNGAIDTIIWPSSFETMRDIFFTNVFGSIRGYFNLILLTGWRPILAVITPERF